MEQLIKIVTISTISIVLGACVSSPSALSGYKKADVSNYECGTDSINVTYLNKDQNSVALLSINKGVPVLLANVVAASGARYVGGIYQLWEKGESATLTNFMKDPRQGIQCKKVL